MKLVNARQLTQETQLSSRTMLRLRSAEKWELGIHYFKISETKILYNLELIQDWIANLHQIQLHEKAIENFLASLPSSQAKPQRKTNKKAARTASKDL
jgi:hypothetical protein